MLAALLIATLSITACGGSGTQGSSASSDGEEAADFNVATLDGEGFGLADKRGEVVALYFMAAY